MAGSIRNGGLLSSKDPNLAKEMEEGNEVHVHRHLSCTVQGKFKTSIGFCVCVLLLLLVSSSVICIPTILGERVCSATEVVSHCQRRLMLYVPEQLVQQGPPGESCKVFAKVGQDPPCCYSDKAFGLYDDVCFAEHNIDRPTGLNCRNGSRYPEVKMVGNHCELILKDVDEQDAGCYHFYMPPNSKQPFYRKCVEFADICAFSLKYSCKVRLVLIQLVCAFFGLSSVAVFLRWDQIRLGWKSLKSAKNTALR